jgi:hypothetical protein
VLHQNKFLVVEFVDLNFRIVRFLNTYACGQLRLYNVDPIARHSLIPSVSLLSLTRVPLAINEHSWLAVASSFLSDGVHHTWDVLGGFQ